LTSGKEFPLTEAKIHSCGFINVACPGGAIGGVPGLLPHAKYRRCHFRTVGLTPKIVQIGNFRKNLP